MYSLAKETMLVRSVIWKKYIDSSKGRRIGLAKIGGICQ
jgi:hypothetical protein